MIYPNLRLIHLLCGAFAIPGLVVYGVSAVQMAHPKWFAMKPSVMETTVSEPAGYTDARLLARDVMLQRGIRGEIGDIRNTPAGWEISIVVPGTVREIRYDRATGATRIKTSIAGVMGMLNRLHHAAGLWHEYLPLRLWAILAGLISAALLGLGATGIWMWWLRRQERTWGLVLIAANLILSAVVLMRIRAAGP